MELLNMENNVMMQTQINMMDATTAKRYITQHLHFLHLKNAVMLNTNQQMVKPVIMATKQDA